MKKYILLLLSLLIFSNVEAAIIFQEDFDTQADWEPTSNISDCDYNGCSGGGTVDGVPTNWDGWRTDEYWQPATTAGSEATIRISSDNAFGGSGKCLTYTQESASTSPGGGGSAFSSDGILTKELSASYTELYIRYSFKTQPGFKRKWAVGFNPSQIKTFRLINWNGTGSYYDFFSDTVSDLYVILDLQEDEFSVAGNGPYINYFGRCVPRPANYFCDETYQSKAYSVDGNGDFITGWTDINDIDDTALGFYDGNWHTIDVHVKLNSAAGVKDGIYEIKYDGFVIGSLTDVMHVGVGGSSPGWNVVMFGGNAFNNYLGIDDGVYQSGAEQWYAIDNIIIADTPISDTTPVVNPGTDQAVSVNSASISGTYTIEGGRTVSSCTWSNDRGGSGTLTAAGGTITGTVTGLSSGVNVITITVTDSEAEDGSDSLNVTYTPVVSTISTNSSNSAGCMIR